MKISELYKNNKKKLIFLLIALVVLGGYGIYRKLGNEPVPQMTVSVDLSKRLDIEQTVSVNGNIVPAQSAEVNSLFNLEIKEIRVKEGDYVKRNQILAVLDSKALKQDLAISKKQLELASLNLQETLKKSQKAYDDAVLNLENLLRSLENTKALFEAGSASNEEFIQAEKLYKSAQIMIKDFNVSNGRVVATSAQNKSLELQRATYDKQLSSLDDLEIKSPIDGTVTRVNVSLGKFTGDTLNREAMFIIEDIANLKMDVRVSEYDISQVAEGQSVRISSDVTADQITDGVVARISPSGEQKDAISSEMVIPVEIKIFPQKARLISGVSARAIIIVKSRKNVLGVPVDSILEDEAGNYRVVKVDEDNMLRLVDVKPGLEGDFYVELVSGDIKENDRLVLSPDLSMKDATLVAVANEDTLKDNEAVIQGPPAVVTQDN
ncbi:MAG: HlyD family efflux transporter periplasmic adaptor subunit [Proteocatella sp.]